MRSWGKPSKPNLNQRPSLLVHNRDNGDLPVSLCRTVCLIFHVISQCWLVKANPFSLYTQSQTMLCSAHARTTCKHRTAEFHVLYATQIQHTSIKLRRIVEHETSQNKKCSEQSASRHRITWHLATCLLLTIGNSAATPQFTRGIQVCLSLWVSLMISAATHRKKSCSPTLQNTPCQIRS